MKQTLLTLTFGFLATPFLLAQETAVPAPAPDAPTAAPAAEGDAAASAFFKTPKEKQSYALGLNMASQLKRATPDVKDLKLDEVIKGMDSILKAEQSEDFLKGVNLGTFLKQSGTDFDEAAMLLAVRDSIGGEASKITESETRTELMSVQNGISERMEAKKKAFSDKNLSAATEFLEKNGKEEGVVTTPSSLQYKVMKDSPQGGKLREGDIAEVIMASFDMAGNRLDKGMEGKTRKFGQNINKGFNEAMKLMTIGSKYKLWIPPSLAYGEQARPSIPPNTMLIYEVELIAALEPPNKGSAAPLSPGAPGAPGTEGMRKQPTISATTPPVAVEIPANGGKPKVTPVEPTPPAPKEEAEK